jgi:hypothetical protein
MGDQWSTQGFISGPFPHHSGSSLQTAASLDRNAFTRQVSCRIFPFTRSLIQSVLLKGTFERLVTPGSTITALCWTGPEAGLCTLADSLFLVDVFLGNFPRNLVILGFLYSSISCNVVTSCHITS